MSAASWDLQSPPTANSSGLGSQASGLVELQSLFYFLIILLVTVANSIKCN